jgi:hypothetical protein
MPARFSFSAAVTVPGCSWLLLAVCSLPAVLIVLVVLVLVVRMYINIYIYSYTYLYAWWLLLLMCFLNSASTSSLERALCIWYDRFSVLVYIYWWHYISVSCFGNILFDRINASNVFSATDACLVTSPPSHPLTAPPLVNVKGDDDCHVQNHNKSWRRLIVVSNGIHMRQPVRVEK